MNAPSEYAVALEVEVLVQRAMRAVYIHAYQGAVEDFERCITLLRGLVLDKRPNPHALRLTAFPPGDGPYDRWELTVEDTGESLASGSMPMNVVRVQEAADRYHQRLDDRREQA